jgi:hypothetical protein
MMKLLREILEDATGGESTIRANALLANAVALLLFAGVAIANCRTALKHGTEAKIPEGLAAYCASISALKVIQRTLGEKSDTAAPDSK